MPAPPIAALDVGSNTFRLMLAKRKDLWAGKQVYQHIPRLSEKLKPGGRFNPAALARSWEALDDFASLVKEAGATRVLAGATMAARMAADGPELMAEIHRRYGWEAVILTGEEEAYHTATGVLVGLALTDALIFDIGGRSTEFVTSSGGEIIQSRSLPVGVVGLTEDHLSDPVTPDQLIAVARNVRAVLMATNFSDVTPGAALVGTAGTVTTVAALLLKLTEYQPELIQNARLSKDDIAALLDVMAAETVAERARKHSLHPLRADAIVAGLVLVMEIMDFFGQQELTVSDNGLLEGLWLLASRPA